MLWQIMQESFYFVLGPFVYYFLLPMMVAGGILAGLFVFVHEFMPKKGRGS